AVGIFLFPTVRLQLAGCWHDKEVAEITKPSHAAHLCKGKAFNGCMLVAISRAVITPRNCIGTDLNKAVGRCSARECLSQAVVHSRLSGTCASTDKGIHKRRGGSIRCL